MALVMSNTLGPEREGARPLMVLLSRCAADREGEILVNSCAMAGSEDVHSLSLRTAALCNTKQSKN